jgi:hypothetical protein
VYDSIGWFIDDIAASVADKNIIEIKAAGITISGTDYYFNWEIPHYVTFVGKKGGVEYSRTITFRVIP